MDLFLADTVGALDHLLEALPHADTKLQIKMLPLLGYIGKDRVLWPLYHLVMDPSANDQVRRLAAIQLGLAASSSDDPEALGEFGKCGVAVSSLQDMEILFDGIPLDQVSTSMTINSPAAMP